MRPLLRHFLQIFFGLAFALSSSNLYADSYYYSSSMSYPYGRYGNSYSRNSNPPIISLNLDPQSRLNTSFRIAVREDRIGDLKKLVKLGAQLNSKTDDGVTALMLGSRNCSPKVVTELLQMGSNINQKDSHGRTALFYAIDEGCESVVKLLLRSPRIDVWNIDESQRTVFDYAVTTPVLLQRLKEHVRKNTVLRGSLSLNGQKLK